MKYFSPLRLTSSCALRSAVLIIISLSMVIMTSACGKKGPVLPKLATLPEAPQEVTLQQQGNLFVLGWAIPSVAQDGGSAGDLTGYRIKRLRYDAADGCPTCRDPQNEVMEIDLRHPAPGQRIGNRLYWRDLDVRLDSGYSYAIVPLTIGRDEGPAATIYLTAQPPPSSPTALQLEAGDSQITVRWIAPLLSADAKLVGYNLYRRQDNRPFSIVPVNPEPLQETHLLDRGLANGRAYEYRVSAVVRIGDQLQESMATPGAIITPQAGR